MDDTENSFNNIDQNLTRIGFSKKNSKTWYKELPDLTIAIVFDRSKFGKIYYCYLGINFKESKNSDLKINKMDLYFRLDSLPEFTTLCKNILDFEKPNSNRHNLLSDFIEQLEKLLSNFSNTTSIEDFINHHPSIKNQIPLKARNYLKI